MTWRGWWSFCGLGSAGVYAYRGDWTWAVVAAAGALLPLFVRVCGELRAQRAVMVREAAEPCPAPRPRLGDRDHPPWSTAPMPVIPAVAEPGRGRHHEARHKKPRRVPLP